METFEICQLVPDEKSCDVRIQIREKGFYAIELLSSSPTAWVEEYNESVMLRLFINGEHHQDFVLFYGETLFPYRRFLGELDPGAYKLTFQCVSPRSRMEDLSVWVEEVNIEKLVLSDHDQLAIQFSPKLYGRSVYSDYDNLYTDTPLEMLYFIEDWEHGKVIEYQMVFSHEDEGTPAQFLLAKWGRLLDIEYMVRVYINESNEVDHVMYQGPHHINARYKQKLLDNRRPILQTATCNGNFTDDITSDYCFFFLPSYEWKKDEEPREVVMERFPYINDVMDWEAQRQLANNPEVFNQVSNLERYLFVHSSVWDVALGHPTIDFTCRLLGDSTIYSSSMDQLKVGSFSAGYTGPYHYFATAIKLPTGKSYADIEEIEVRLINEELSSVTVKDLKLLSYHRAKGIQTHLHQHIVLELTQSEACKPIWKKERV
ncbi:hypothetical protein [Radiobacillus deserti]|uniref:Uncharacterized protein n=1 Tax=Radiobacillus deserti TaxID=2594883 RepID=A0A516KK58_9BACI|nr:hypothetical protein [Radiobacillus deserti]QDP41762.1 hypothetical protein FN924_17235 [Radiobacillus deserti]